MDEILLKLKEIEQHNKILGREVAYLKATYTEIIKDINILKEGGNI